MTRSARIGASLLALCTTAIADGGTPPPSLTIQNSSPATLSFWLDGQARSLAAGHSLRVPCLADEQHLVQSARSAELVKCGNRLEVHR